MNGWAYCHLGLLNGLHPGRRGGTTGRLGGGNPTQSMLAHAPVWTMMFRKSFGTPLGRPAYATVMPPQRPDAGRWRPPHDVIPGGNLRTPAIDLGQFPFRLNGNCPRSRTFGGSAHGAGGVVDGEGRGLRVRAGVVAVEAEARRRARRDRAV